jgi:exodeoxyribonuclease VII small subunit
MNELTFEDAQKELEQIVRRLEAGEASLDEAIALWQRGEELHRFCLGKLDAAQGEIEELAQRREAASTRPVGPSIQTERGQGPHS